MQKRKFQIIWFLVLLLGASLACQTLTGVEQDINKVKDTAVSLGTQIELVATQVGGIATSIEKSGALKTAGVFATAQGGKILGTFEALVTEAEQRGLQETVQSFITQEGSQALNTIEALATQGINKGQAPADIPIPAEGQIINFVGTDQIVTFSVKMDYPATLDFYKTQMPASGWTPVIAESVEHEHSAVLKFTQTDRTATVLLTYNSLDQTTLVAILIGK